MTTQVRGRAEVFELPKEETAGFGVQARVVPIAQNGAGRWPKLRVLAQAGRKGLECIALAWFGVLGDGRTALVEDAKWRATYLAVVGNSPSEPEARRP